MTRKLEKSLTEQKKATQQKNLELFGTLGIPLGGQHAVDVIGRPNFVYVQLRTNQNEVIQAFNNQVAQSYGLPVKVVRDSGRYIVLGVDTARYQNNWDNNAPFLPRHGTTHSFDDNGGGADITWIYGHQFMPLLVFPNANSGTAGTANVYISPNVLQTSSGTFSYVGDTGTALLTMYLPTGAAGSIMALVYLDKTTGNPGLIVNSGTHFSSAFTSKAQVTPYIPALTNPATQIPLGAVRLPTGTTSFDWSYIYDVRQFVEATATGSSSGGGGGGSSIDTIGFVGQANGVYLATGTILNVRGTNVAFTVSGTAFDLFITGSGGTVNPPVSGTVVVQNNGFPLGSVTTLNFTNGVTASVSGSVAQITATGTSVYVRTAVPTSLSSITGSYWKVPDSSFVTGSLALFNQGHVLIPSIDYVEQYASSGTFQYISTPPTGTYNLAIYGVLSNGAGGTSSGSGSSVLVQKVGNVVSFSTGTSTSLPYDDTIPQSNEGYPFLSQTITPTNSSNILYIHATVFGSVDGTDYMCMALFQDANVNAIAAVAEFVDSATASATITLTYKMVAGTTSPTTFKINAGKNGGGTFRINGRTSTGRIFGGSAASSITIEEVTP